MRIRGIGFAALRLVLSRQLFDVMALAGAAEDQKSGRQRETGFAKKKSHNASDSKRLGLAGARRKAQGGSSAPSRDVYFTRFSAPFFSTSSDGTLDPTGATLRIESRFRRITVSRSGPNF
jgi:hypothetical protein